MENTEKDKDAKNKEKNKYREEQRSNERDTRLKQNKSHLYYVIKTVGGNSQ